MNKMKNNEEFILYNPEFKDCVFLQDEFVDGIVGFDASSKKLVYSLSLMRDDLIDAGIDPEEADYYLEINILRNLKYINNCPIVLIDL
jgi:hypothetical protein